MASVEEIISTLQGVSEDLADKSLDALKEAHRDGQAKRPERERQITQARRAVEKAIGVLSRLD